MIRNLKNNKTTGTDDLLLELYKSIYPCLSSQLVDLWNHVLQTGETSTLWLESSIGVISKENKDPTNPASFRSIALLNHDAKVLSTWLANRLKSFFQGYIMPDWFYP